MTKIIKLILVIFTSFIGFSDVYGFALQLDNDTLNKTYFDSMSYKIYTSPGGGYVSGNNAYKDQSKVQEFHAGNLCNIYGLLINFGYLNFSSLSDSSYVGINFYHLNNSGRNTFSNTVPCPGNIFHKDSIKVSDIDTANGNYFSYSNPIYTDSNLAIGVNFNHLNPLDTIAIFTNKDGDAGSREYSWEQDLNGNWFTLKYSWPMNVDYAIFPIVNTTVGFDMLSSQKQEFNISPNPSSNGITQLNIAKSSILNFKVYNSNLQLIPSNIYSISENKCSLQLENVIKGVYFIQIKTHEFIGVKKFIVN
jgi:hypothetical protein